MGLDDVSIFGIRLVSYLDYLIYTHGPKAIECYIYKWYGYMNCKKKTKKNEEQSQAALLASSLILCIAL